MSEIHFNDVSLNNWVFLTRPNNLGHREYLITSTVPIQYGCLVSMQIASIIKIQVKDTNF